MTRDGAAGTTPRLLSVHVYGRGKYATSRGLSIELRIGRFYLHIDLGRIV